MPAYWISPKNEIIDVPTIHIDSVIKNPEIFGLTLDHIKEVYNKYGEQLGSEGKAREEIIIDLVKKGWIRIRQYRIGGWTVNVGELSKKVKDNLFDWAMKITTNGIFGYKERDIYNDVNIVASLSGKTKKVTLKKIMNSVLYESNEVFESVNELELMVLKENKMKNWVDFLKENW